MLRAFCLGMALAVLSAGPLAAQEDEGLEEWQQRILRALEDADADAETPADTRDRQNYSSQPGDAMDEARAAEEARRRYGGRALAVVRVGDSYRVRLLLDSGHVTTVTIRD